MRLLKLLLIVFVCAAGPVVAGPLDDGRAAWQKGDYATAMRLWRPIADQGDANAQYNLGFMYEKGQGVPQDYATAVSWFRKAAEQGLAKAQFNLGVMYAKGQGVPQDYAAAMSWYRKAADQGYADAQTHLGLMYDNGQGVPQNYAAAVSWYRKAADKGYADAQTNLGVMYAKGQGVPQDYATAVSWFRKAADQGVADAQYNLSVMYHNGQGVPQDYAAAVAWFRKAADQGVASAQYNLGFMYSEGQGVPQDYVQAHKWWNLAASRFDASKKEYRDKAAKGRDQIAAKMTPAQLAEAQKLAREWKPTQPIVSPAAPTVSAPPPQRSVSGLSIPMKREGGTYVVPVLINNAITLDFTVDSGASDVSIPEDVVSTLIRAGTIRDTDFIGEQTYVLADGSRVKSKTFRIRSLKVGDRVLENVTGSVAGRNGTLLLGQSFLGRFKSWSIDNTKHALVLE